MNSIKIIVCGFAITFLLITSKAKAQKKDELISEKQQLAIFNKSIQLLKENYVFPEKIAGIETEIKMQFANKQYAAFINVVTFTKKLTEDLELYGKDRHLGIFYSKERVSKIKSQNNLTEIPKSFLSKIKSDNYGLRKVERLEGNIGYFNFTGCEAIEYSQEALVGAMNFISNSDAIIIDIRQNRGGPLDFVLFFENYFLPDSTKVGTFIRRLNNESVEMYTTKDPTIKKVPPNIPVYILVDNKTSSAAEAIAYDLQQFKRATIIGEQTLGEANPSTLFVINDQLFMVIPTATSKNIISGTNWEQVGVEPDIRTEKNKALTVAIIEASKSIIASTKNKDQQQLLKWQLPILENEINEQPLTGNTISNVIGDYEENRKIISENGLLYFVNLSGKFKMKYVGNNTFLVFGKEYRFVFPDLNKSVKSYTVIWDDEGTEEIKRIVK